MSLKQQISDDTKDAMKARDADKVSTLRFLQAAVKNKEIELRPNALTDEDVVTVLRKSVKQRQDSIEQYVSAGRTDLADKEKMELSIIEGYLPKQMSADQIEAVARHRQRRRYLAGKDFSGNRGPRQRHDDGPGHHVVPERYRAFDTDRAADILR